MKAGNTALKALIEHIAAFSSKDNARYADNLSLPFVGQRQLEDVFYQIHCNGCSMHLGLLSLTPPNDSAWHYDAAQRAGGVHPIIRA